MKYVPVKVGTNIFFFVAIHIMVNYVKSRKKLEKALKFVCFDFLKFQLDSWRSQFLKMIYNQSLILKKIDLRL
jgi:hypothetical protein